MNHYNYNEAEKIVSQTLDNHYDDAKTYYLKGLITAATKSKAESIAEWERGLRNYPNSGLLNYELAIANRSLSDNKKAEKYINHALKVEPNNADYLNLKKELKIVNEDKN
ncbi:MAG: rhomboid family intramembrane serine protease, partial [Staphylococcus lugdunensis]|nr:rhomboid family intramembrane serine protease [Staphylococcus lugdunensis]